MGSTGTSVLERGRESEVIRASQAPIQTLSFSSDSKLLAAGDTQRIARIWYQGQNIREFDLTSRQDKIRPTERIRGLAFSPKGNSLYTACGDLVQAFCMTTGHQRWMFRPTRNFGFLIVSPIALAVSASGDVAVATDAGRLSLWTSEGATRSHFWDNDGPRHLGFIDDDRIIGTDSFSICTWKIGMGRKLSRKKLKQRVYGFAVAQHAGLVCLRTIHDVQIWDIHTDTLVATYPVPFGPPLVAFSPDGRKLYFGGTHEIVVATIGDDNTETIQVEGASVRSLAVQPDGSRLVAGCSDGSIRFWDLT